MAIELVVPTVGESITEVEIGSWLKTTGDYVEKDEAIVEIESDKATLEVYAPVAGTLGEIVKRTGETAVVGELIAYFEEGGAPAVKAEAAAEAPGDIEEIAAAASVAVTATAAPAAAPMGPLRVMPSARRVLAEKGLRAVEVQASGPGGRLLKEDVLRAEKPAAIPPAGAEIPGGDGQRQEESVRMTPFRRRVAQQLVSAQQTAALLTTFNEADMTAIIELRKEYKDDYERKYEVRLGFMSFFVKAAIEALKALPAANAEVRGEDIVYKNYYDIGIAVSGKKGLAVPVLRNAERMSFAEIERAIGDMGRRARDGKIGVEELRGGTFTISNGGIFGSLMSTPIINPPQSAILGMHKIQQRPVVRDGEIVARPMMYLALTYDHRIIDGREAVGFLVRIKECIEDPSRILLEI
ncbi:MAG: 2-oxoglutarate dehydrogenase complex dihydrolipoyllysine-residue succinyltransferase [Candidatus Hydrogenedentes bacterium]|nr:2-oxoglutarate dehydrogenase complex dihydrolipoyllysine-residue succinyltransferase [Candidatus Hydrogenedentota bacterium]